MRAHYLFVPRRHLGGVCLFRTPPWSMWSKGFPRVFLDPQKWISRWSVIESLFERQRVVAHGWVPTLLSREPTSHALPSVVHVRLDPARLHTQGRGSVFLLFVFRKWHSPFRDALFFSTSAENSGRDLTALEPTQANEVNRWIFPAFFLIANQKRKQVVEKLLNLYDVDITRASFSSKRLIRVLYETLSLWRV